MPRDSRKLLRNYSELCKFFLNIFETVSVFKTPMGRTLDITDRNILAHICVSRPML